LLPVDRHRASRHSASLIKDPDVYERYENIGSFMAAAGFRTRLWRRAVAKLRDGTNCSVRCCREAGLLPDVTREPFRNRGRITDLITSEQLFNDIDQARSTSRPTAS